VALYRLKPGPEKKRGNAFGRGWAKSVKGVVEVWEPSFLPSKRFKSCRACCGGVREYEKGREKDAGRGVKACSLLGKVKNKSGKRMG